MTAALQTEHAPNPRLDPDVARAEAEGMVTETAKVSATVPQPTREPSPAHEDQAAKGWSFRDASLARPRAQRWLPSSIVVATAVLAVVFVAVILSLI